MFGLDVDLLQHEGDLALVAVLEHTLDDPAAEGIACIAPPHGPGGCEPSGPGGLSLCAPHTSG